MYDTRQHVDIYLGKAISAALFDGDLDRVECVEMSPSDQFEKLKNGEIAMLAQTAVTMERDVRGPTTEQGFAFSSPGFHDEIRLVGNETS